MAAWSRWIENIKSFFRAVADFFSHKFKKSVAIKQDINQNIVGLYHTAKFFPRISSDQIARLPEISIAITQKRGYLRPLIESDLQGHSIVRGVDTLGVPFIGFIAQDSSLRPTVFTLIGYEAAGVIDWKVCAKDIKDTKKERVEFVQLRSAGNADLERFFSLMYKQFGPPQVVAPLSSSEPSVSRSLLSRFDGFSKTPPQRSDLKEVETLYPKKMLDICGLDNIAALPLVCMKKEITSGWTPQFSTPGLDKFGANKIIRGQYYTDEDIPTTPFISYISTVSGKEVIVTLFQYERDWKIIRNDKLNKSYHSYSKDLQSVSDNDLRELSSLFNSRSPRYSS